MQIRQLRRKTGSVATEQRSWPRTNDIARVHNCASAGSAPPGICPSKTGDQISAPEGYTGGGLQLQTESTPLKIRTENVVVELG